MAKPPAFLMADSGYRFGDGEQGNAASEEGTEHGGWFGGWKLGEGSRSYVKRWYTLLSEDENIIIGTGEGTS